jgi:hypothetical protein
MIKNQFYGLDTYIDIMDNFEECPQPKN